MKQKHSSEHPASNGSYFGLDTDGRKIVGYFFDGEWDNDNIEYWFEPEVSVTIEDKRAGTDLFRCL